MELDLFNTYREKNSLVHGLDARTKIISLFFFIAVASTMHPAEWQKTLIYGIPLTAVILMSKIPLTHVIKRSLVILPFMLLILISIPFMENGTSILIGVLAKSWLSILAMILLISTTPLPDLLKGFERLKVPKMMVSTVSFMVRYVTVLTDELLRMKRARDLRSSGGTSGWHIKTAGNIIGNLFIRSFERAEKIYLAMNVRGYEGEIKTFGAQKIKLTDAVFCAAFIMVITCMKLTL